MSGKIDDFMSTPLLVALLVLFASFPLGYTFLTRPGRTILPLYAGLVPIGSTFKLSLPFPSPFNTLSSVAGMVLVAACLMHILLYRRALVPRLPVAAWLLFLAWTSVTLFWSLDAGASVSQLAIAVPLVMMVVVIGLFPVDEVDLDVLRVTVIAGGAIVGLYAVYLVATGKSFASHGVSERFALTSSTSQETNPNILAASLMLPLAMAVECVVLPGRRWLGRRGWRMVGSGTGLLILAAVVFTGSRGGLIAAFATIAVALVVAQRIPMAAAAVRGVLILGVVIIMLVVATIGVIAVRNPTGTVAQTVAGDAVGRLTNESSSGRTEIWQTGLIACRTYCAWGVGIGNFATVYGAIHPFSAVEKNVGGNRPAHDVYLSVAVETGLLGLSLLALALLAEWMSLSMRALQNVAVGLKAAIAGLLVSSIFLSAIWFKYFWLIFCVIRVAENALIKPDARLTPPVDGSTGGSDVTTMSDDLQPLTSTQA
jgi:hypothetical protein